jgi:type III secretion system FlhB-like substrate exporter
MKTKFMTRLSSSRQGRAKWRERIERAARDYGVDIVRDVPLADALSELRIGDPIPEALCESIATILSEIAARGSI